MSKTDTLMKHIDSCISASLSYARAERECATYQDCTDERKHYAAVWCALRDMIKIEVEPEEVEWVEAEESVRGSRLLDVLTNPSVTVIWHSSKPKTSNPVWEVRGNLFTAIR